MTEAMDLTDAPPFYGSRTNLGALVLSLAKAQAAFAAIVRDKEVDSRSYKFKYAPLDAIISAVRPALSANGLAFVQLLDGDDLVTMLLHESGAYISGRIALSREGTIQQYGSAITYLRRYALQAILGVAAEEDDDGEQAAKAPVRTVNRTTGEIRTQTPRQAPSPVSVAPGLSQTDIAALHAAYGEAETAPDKAWAADEIEKALDGIAPSGGLSTAELFSQAETVGIPKARLTVAAKTLFGADRWKIADLSDQERYELWESLGVVDGAPA